jgi:hypothetical protein
MIQARNQGHLVPESTGQVQDRDTRVPVCNVLENSKRIVAAPVEHIHYPKGVTLGKTRHNTRDRLMKNWKPFFLFVNGQNNIDFHCWIPLKNSWAFTVYRSPFTVHVHRPGSRLMYRGDRREVSRGASKKIHT